MKFLILSAKQRTERMKIKLLQDLFFWLKHLKEISIIMNEVIKIFLKGAFRNPFLLEEIHQEILKQLDEKMKKGNKLMLFTQYKRTYENFDKCMEAFEQIILICKKQENFEIAKVIKDTLNKLERIENE